mmetsp:Transcript_9188/g.13596  ORF Transcript_9188/g.13596 Transcript_9188/m.13596 type:complete len:232 (-) Transcript_9188:26-721(-)
MPSSTSKLDAEMTRPSPGTKSPRLNNTTSPTRTSLDSIRVLTPCRMTDTGHLLSAFKRCLSFVFHGRSESSLSDSLFTPYKWRRMTKDPVSGLGLIPVSTDDSIACAIKLMPPKNSSKDTLRDEFSLTKSVTFNLKSCPAPLVDPVSLSVDGFCTNQLNNPLFEFSLFFAFNVSGPYNLNTSKLSKNRSGLSIPFGDGLLTIVVGGSDILLICWSISLPSAVNSYCVVVPT